jgi:hypothetical protein
LAHASRSASDPGGAPRKKATVSNTIRSAPWSASSRSRARSAGEPSKKRGWRTSTPQRWPPGNEPRNVASTDRSPGPKVPGSWIEIVSARAPSGPNRATNEATSRSARRRRRSWVIVRGSLKTKRKSSGVSPAQAATVSADGSP